MRQFLGVALLAITIIAVVLASCADPPESPPGFALNSSAIWRLQVFIVALIAIDIPLSLIVGAFHGRMLTSLNAGAAGAGTGRVTTPDPDQTSGIDEVGGAVKELRKTVEDGFKDLGPRVSRLEKATGVDDATQDDR
jgi:hypothetical protein